MFSLGQKIKVSQRGGHERLTTIIKGTVIYINDFFITIKTKNYNTSVNLIDFKTGIVVLLQAKNHVNAV